MLKVVNLRNHGVEYDVYVGRPSRWVGLAGSEWANPHKMQGETDAERRHVVIMFENDLFHDIDRANRMRWALGGKTLACWCAPKLCHAHIISWLANCPLSEYEEWKAGRISATAQVERLLEAPDGDGD